MLENGDKILGCQIDGQIDNNLIYATYSAVLDDTSVRVMLFKDLDTEQRQTALTQVQSLSTQIFPDVALPLAAGLFEDQLVCLLPECKATLHELLQEPYPLAEALALVRRIAIALLLPHAAGLSHGSLSPHCISLQPGAPLLHDFALNSLVKLDFDSGIVPQYVSPEQVRGDDPSCASDIYSLGCLMYLLLCGEPPFAEGDHLFVSLQQQHDGFPALPQSAQFCVPLLEKMVASQADERPTADQLISEIETLLNQAKSQDAGVVEPSNTFIATDVESLDEEDETTSSEIAAKIEARLQELAQSEPPLQPSAANSDVLSHAEALEGLDEVDLPTKSLLMRYLLLLLIGIILGVVLYAFLFDRPRTMKMSTSDATNHLTMSDMELGVELWRQGEYDSAAAEYLRLIGLSPEDPRPYNNLAAIYVSMGDYDRARMLLEQALNTDASYATVYQNLSSVYAEMARDSYGKALQLDGLKSGLELEVFSGRKDYLPPVVDTDVTTEETEMSDSKSDIVEEVTLDSATVSNVSEVNDEGPLEVPLTEHVDPSTMPIVTAGESEETEDKPFESPDTDAELLEIMNFLNGWAQSWSSQNVDAYLSHYAEEFLPRSGVSRQAWEQQRRNRLAKPSAIKVSLDNFTLVENSGDRLLVDVEQSYSSDVYSDLTRKRFELRREGSDFKIVDERALEVIR
jgi:hypothetical protein